MEEKLIMKKKLITICVPVYNEENNILPFYQSLTNVVNQETHYDFEFLFTDNHSDDATFVYLSELAQNDSRVRVIRFSKNFGFQKSIMTNYLNAQGDAAIQIDCDLQDPPELISAFLQKWELGAKVVYGIRKNRPEAKWLHLTRKIYYRLISYLSEDYLPPDAGDFRLIDRCIIEELRKVNDNAPYIRGLIASMGFNQIGIPYDRKERKAGYSKFNMSRLFSLALDGILQHTTIPLRLASIFGAFVSVLALLGGLYYFIAKIFFYNEWPVGLASLSILLLFSIGLNALFLGIIGEYISAIFKNIKKSPFTIIESRIDNLPQYEIMRAPLQLKNTENG